LLRDEARGLEKFVAVVRAIEEFWVTIVKLPPKP